MPTVALPEGRQVGFAEFGARDGRPLVYCHGTPTSGLDAVALDAAARAHGMRVVAPDRPGVGLSDPRPPWAVADWPADAAALADALEIERFGVLGWSGGGPYALACAWALPERVGAVTVVSGSASSEAGGKGMAMTDRALESVARRSPTAARALLAPVATAARRRPTLARWLFALDLPPADRETLAAAPAGFQDMSFFREAFRQGTRGAALDYRALGTPWGFALEDVAAPVTLWQGGADRIVPAGHAEYMAARLPHATLRREPASGHLLLLSHAGEILRDAAG